MRVVRPEFLPDASLDRAEMAAMQVALAEDAVFEDDGVPPLDDIWVRDGVAGVGNYNPDGGPVLVGVDQAFRETDAVSAAVAVQDGRVVEQADGQAPLDFPYIPGLLSFREAPAIVDALESLETPADVLVLDGSGRIHFRQAGIATHVGVLFDTPALGVAKNLLCGTPRRSLDDPLREGERVAIEANRRVDAEAGTVIGYAYQSRQYPNPEKRHVNPLYVSPGHRIGAETAVEIVAATCAGYKLPEPTRLADQRADELKR